MSVQSPALRRSALAGSPPAAVIDVDVHPRINPRDPRFLARLPQRWRAYMEMIGIRPFEPEYQIVRHRPGAARTDAAPPDGSGAGGSPAFAVAQLLDAYDMRAAILNNITSANWGSGAISSPVEMQAAMARAVNDWHHDEWLACDPRWRASINVPWEQPPLAIAEIERCVALSDRFLQVLIESRAEAPIGNPRYWPVYECAVAHDLPVAFHVGAGHRISASGTPSFYFEDHVNFPIRNFNIASSLIFEGVFDRFPTLKIALLELGWSWAVPYAWRLDAAWRLLSDEVPTLQRAPSEYLREHFWFSSQPMEEPERLEWFGQVLEQFQAFGLAEKLMYSSDYPHWDFDAPDEAIPLSLPPDTRARLLSGNASALYGIPAQVAS